MSTAFSKSLPGFHAPAASFEQPFEMLEACRARVRRTLALLGKLVEHIDKQGHGEQSRSAAADVLRYFNLAAPLHHQDEEINVFPVLPGRDDAAMTLTVEALKRDHVQMGLWWAQLQQPLQRWSQAGANEAVEDATRSAVARFRALYATHLQAEEGLVFPAARALMDRSAQSAIGQQMQARRRT